MSNIVYIGPDKYANLKSDLITKNKADAVSFEFTGIEKCNLIFKLFLISIA